MNSEQFKAWRKHMRLSQQKAADALGMSISAIANYERGVRVDFGTPVAIPHYIALACAALALGISDYSGPKESPKAIGQ